MSILTLFILLIASIGGAPIEKRHFAHAGFIPRDVSSCVQLERGAALAAALRAEGIGDVLIRTVLSEEIEQVWSSLARLSRRDDGALFDDLAGRRLTLVTRTNGGRREWAVISEIDPITFEKVTLELRAQILSGGRGVAMRRLPEQELLLAHRGAYMLAGPSTNSTLLSEMIRLVGGETVPTLADDPVLGQIQNIPPGAVNLLVRHDPPMGGWTAASFAFENGVVQVRHASNFTMSPLTSRVPSRALDLSIAQRFAEKSVLSIATPIDQTDGFAATFLQMVLLGNELQSDSIRNAIGERIVWVFGETESGQVKEGEMSTLPAVAVAVEMRAPNSITGESFRASMQKLATSLRQASGDHAPSDANVLQEDQVYHIDLPTVGRALLPGMTPASEFSLSWTVMNKPGEHWWVISSNPDHLRDVVTALEAESTSDVHIDAAAPLAAWGRASGGRAADHLRGLRPIFRQLALPEDVSRIDGSVQRLIDVADMIDNVEWRVSRPTVNTLQGEMIITPRRSSAADRHRGKQSFPRQR